MLYTTVKNEQDVHDILALQAENHKTVVNEQTAQSQGFVTVKHDFDTLLRMNLQNPSVIARSGDQLAGYALMMPQSFRHDIPILEPMFQMLDTLDYRRQPLSSQQWFVMGQICVGEAFRGQGVFDGLYSHLRDVWRHDFDFVITEISERNTRSSRAHERVGFQTLHVYPDETTGEIWRMVVWDWGK